MNGEKHWVDFELSSIQMKILNDITCNLKFSIWIEFTFTFKSDSVLIEFQCNWTKLKSLHFLDCSILTPFVVSHKCKHFQVLYMWFKCLIAKKPHKSQLSGLYQINYNPNKICPTFKVILISQSKSFNYHLT
jgi:hypothetical protein